MEQKWLLILQCIIERVNERPSGLLPSCLEKPFPLIQADKHFVDPEASPELMFPDLHV